MNYIKLALLTIFISGCISAQESNYERSVKYEKKAVDNYLNRDYDSFLMNMKEAEKLRPNHPRLLYNLAAAYSLNNDKTDALAELRKLVYMKLYYRPEKDSDFVSLWEDSRFKHIIDGFDINLFHIGTSTTAFTFPEKDLITESVAYDSLKDNFYLSSVYRRKIVFVNINGETGVFKDEGEDGLWSVFGIKIDSQRRILWVCTGAIEQADNYNKNDLGKTAVFKYNIDSKKLIRKYDLDNKENGHLFGDLTLSSSGDVFISDSKYNAIYKIDAASDSMKIFIRPGSFISLQGLDLSPDNRTLFFADYALGLFKLNLETKAFEEIQSPQNFTPLGIDGLYFYKNSFIATQNGVNPQRVVRIYLNNNMDSITGYKILESNNPYFDEITLGLQKGNYFYYIANGQWGSFDKKGNIFPQDRLKEPRVLKMVLNSN